MDAAGRYSGEAPGVGDQAKIQVVGPDFTFSDAQTDIVNEILKSKFLYQMK